MYHSTTVYGYTLQRHINVYLYVMMHQYILICNKMFLIGMIYATTKYFYIILEYVMIGIDIWRYYVIMGSIQDNNNTTTKATQWTSSQSQCWQQSLSHSPWSASGMPNDILGESKILSEWAWHCINDLVQYKHTRHDTHKDTHNAYSVHYRNRRHPLRSHQWWLALGKR